MTKPSKQEQLRKAFARLPKQPSYEEQIEMCKAKGILVTPLWRNSVFYPYLSSSVIDWGVKGKWIFPGQNIFIQGSDKSSFFGPDFNCGVVVWKLDFK